MRVLYESISTLIIILNVFCSNLLRLSCWDFVSGISIGFANLFSFRFNFDFGSNFSFYLGCYFGLDCNCFLRLRFKHSFCAILGFLLLFWLIDGFICFYNFSWTWPINLLYLLYSMFDVFFHELLKLNFGGRRTFRFGICLTALVILGIDFRLEAAYRFDQRCFFRLSFIYLIRFCFL